MTITILVKADYFLGWAGGANLLGRIVRSLIIGSKITGDRIVIALHKQRLKDTPENSGVFCLPVHALSKHGIFGTFISESMEVESIYFYNDFNDLLDLISPDLIAPVGVPLNRCPIPWLGYIADFQHEYLPHFFSADECHRRDSLFRSIVRDSQAVFVNSRTVENDIERFFPGYIGDKRIFKFPELPFRISHEDREPVCPSLPSTPYFISCSQRWIHKQHPLIISSFHRLVDQGLAPEGCELIFTGETSDYRNASHAAEVESLIRSLGLSNRVRSLGLIDRSHQLALIKNSSALIQASLFEGGAGASGMHEAALLDTPIIASDISPNLEFDTGKIWYFNRFDPNSLCDAMASVLKAVFSNKYRFVTDPSILETRIAASGLILLDRFKHILVNARS